jgi:hypothetical protein
VLGGTKVGEGSGDLESFSVNNFEAFCECDEVY